MFAEDGDKSAKTVLKAGIGLGDGEAPDVDVGGFGWFAVDSRTLERADVDDERPTRAEREQGVVLTEIVRERVVVDPPVAVGEADGGFEERRVDADRSARRAMVQKEITGSNSS